MLPRFTVSALTLQLWDCTDAVAVKISVLVSSLYSKRTRLPSLSLSFKMSLFPKSVQVALLPIKLFLGLPLHVFSRDIACCIFMGECYHTQKPHIFRLQLYFKLIKLLGQIFSAFSSKKFPSLPTYFLSHCLPLFSSFLFRFFLLIMQKYLSSSALKTNWK